MRKRKFNLLLIIFVVVIILGLGYAYLTTTLSINGTTNVDANTWNIYWDNVQVKSGSVSATTPAISNQTTVSFSVHLSKPGDFYEFTVDAKNSGTIDAMIDDFIFSVNGYDNNPLPDYLLYSITYDDNLDVTPQQILKANSTETYKIRVEYSTDIYPEDLPSTSDSITISFGVIYVQATSAAQEVGHKSTTYTISYINTYIGEAIPNGVIQYSTPAEAMAAFSNRPFYLKHIIQNGIVIESYVELVITPAMASANPGMTAGTYALRGGINENSLTTKPIYESNKATLLNSFGNANCGEESVIGNVRAQSCQANGIIGFANSIGIVYYLGSESWICHVVSEEYSDCSNDDAY